jgi:glyoxylase-like metal-dependent hydrolase (beta-lactamase superfamily II)
MAEVTAEIIQVRSGTTDNFSYLVVCPQTGAALGIDPGRFPESLLEVIHQRGLTLEVLANTHGHRDHIDGNERVLRETGARLAAHCDDLPAAEQHLEDGGLLKIGVVAVRVLHTPGHSPGSLTFNPPGGLITGDTLFVTRCGRADLPGGDPAALYRSLQRLAGFPDETLVYPGHDYGPQPQSTMAFERENNPYLQCPDLESFLALRMA